MKKTYLAIFLAVALAGCGGSSSDVAQQVPQVVAPAAQPGQAAPQTVIVQQRPQSGGSFMDTLGHMAMGAYIGNLFSGGSRNETRVVEREVVRYRDRPVPTPAPVASAAPAAKAPATPSYAPTPAPTKTTSSSYGSVYSSVKPTPAPTKSVSSSYSSYSPSKSSSSSYSSSSSRSSSYGSSSSYSSSRSSYSSGRR